MRHLAEAHPLCHPLCPVSSRLAWKPSICDPLSGVPPPPWLVFPPELPLALGPSLHLGPVPGDGSACVRLCLLQGWAQGRWLLRTQHPSAETEPLRGRESRGIPAPTAQLFPASPSHTRLFYRYQDLAPQLVPLDYTSSPDVKVPYELISSMPELKVCLAV